MSHRIAVRTAKENAHKRALKLKGTCNMGEKKHENSSVTKQENLPSGEVD